MATKIRLTGIDLVRCIAIFGVILVHSDEGVANSPQGWIEILEFSSFAVPFFLAASFYFTFNKIYATGGEYFIKQRLTRLLVPYLFWTAIYIGYKVLKYSLQNEVGNLGKLFQDPVSLLLFGGAAFQLYFLPLLIAGTIMVKPLLFLIKNQANVRFIILLLILSLIGYEIIVASGNSFEIGTGKAFQGLLSYPQFLNWQENQVVRIILTELALIIRCLPYIFMAAILSHPRSVSLWQNNSKIVTILWILAFVAINIFGKHFLPASVYELFQGYFALLLGIALSHQLQNHKFIDSLSSCSFGIYLIHLLFVEILQTVEARIYPDGMFRSSTPNLLIFALFILGLSWIATDMLMRQKSLAKLMFGV